GRHHRLLLAPVASVEAHQPEPLGGQTAATPIPRFILGGDPLFDLPDPSAQCPSRCCRSMKQSAILPAAVRIGTGTETEGAAMATNYSVCLGTVGWGVWHSPDAGESWTRHRAPFPLNSRIQALVAHPTE